MYIHGLVDISIQVDEAVPVLRLKHHPVSAEFDLGYFNIFYADWTIINDN